MVCIRLSLHRCFVAVFSSGKTFQWWFKRPSCERWEAIYIYITGWWFGTFVIFPYIGNFILPIDFHIFQRGAETTNQRILIPDFLWAKWHFFHWSSLSAPTPMTWMMGWMGWRRRSLLRWSWSIELLGLKVPSSHWFSWWLDRRIFA